MKKIAIVSVILFLTACNELPKSESIVRYYSTSYEEVIMQPKYISNNSSTYYEYTCIEDEAIAVKKAYSDQSILSAEKVGTACVELNMIDIKKVEEFKPEEITT